MTIEYQQLIDAVVSIAREWHIDDINGLSKLIKKDNDLTQATISKVGTNPATKKQLSTLYSIYNNTRIDSNLLLGMLVGAASAYSNIRNDEQFELVWSGPHSRIVPSRSTEQVILSVIDRARKELFLISFVAYEITDIVDALNNAINRGVNIVFLLESDKVHGGSLNTDSIGTMREAIPKASHYYWAEKDAKFVGGSVHGKSIVADESVCLITSANLTGHAMDKNMEIGVMIHGGDIPRKLHQHLKSLIQTNIIKEI